VTGNGHRVLLTLGDPNGIGPEIAVKAALELGETGMPPVLVGDHYVIDRYAAELGARTRMYAGEPEPGAIDVIAIPALPPAEFRPGTVSAAAGAATVAYLEAAVRLLGEGFRGIVACPHSETAVNSAGIPFRGYPPLLARLAGVSPDRMFLLLIGGGLRIVHATLHERLADAVERLTPDTVCAAALAAHEALTTLGIAHPRLGVFGINPHAGEGGLFGDDDERVTVPAVRRLRECGLDVEGPIGADTMLAAGGRDAYVAMYHDQGHIPVKLLSGRTSSALAIGAGIAFSSVGHGAAFDIAGSGVADPAAAVAAVRLLAGADLAAAAIGERA
jgi:4-hydroxythreonine-4-phosphate dehydrogenase